MSRTDATRHAQRGQVLPMWTMGAITTLALMFLAINYANAVRYQVRAQNAADSAAQAIVAIQAQRYNLMTMMLYASGTEEYRLRKLLDGTMLSLYWTGGCNIQITLPVVPGPPTIYNSNDANSCSKAYIGLRGEFLKSVNRYTNDITFLNDVASTNTYTNLTSDATQLLGTLNSAANCTNPTNAPVRGDCSLKYHIVAAQERTGLAAVTEDAAAIDIPGNGNSAGPLPDLENKELFAPAAFDISTCVVVPPIIPNFGPIHLAPTYAVGRAAAANVMIEEDWMQPGAIVDPQRTLSTAFFQPAEAYAPTSGADNTFAGGSNGTEYDWYGINFGGNVTYAFAPQTAFQVDDLDNDEFSVRVGWWNAIPIRPFGGTATTATACS